MLQWLGAHSGALSAAASFTMVAVWVIYLQLFWKSYNRQLRANILITPGAGLGLEARCLISNMSAEPVFIEAILLVLEKDGTRWSKALTSLGGISQTQDDETSAPRELYQGPLRPAAYMDIGKFSGLLERAREALWPDGAEAASSFDAFEIWAIADYSPELRLVSVRRRFAVTWKEGRIGLVPERIQTEQVRRGRRRRQLERMLDDHMSGLSD